MGCACWFRLTPGRLKRISEANDPRTEQCAALRVATRPPEERPNRTGGVSVHDSINLTSDGTRKSMVR